jgi:polyribonucleotide nucleotidyltransferase
MIIKKEFTEVVYETSRQGKQLILKTGKLAPHCDGAVEITLWGTQLLVTAVMQRDADADKDFMPLGVEYRESWYAAGKIGGGRFMKREGRPSDEAVLYARLVDRALRPMFPKGMVNDVVVTISPLAIDRQTSPGEVSIIWASVAVMLAGIPFTGPVSGVRIAEENGQLIVGATEQQAMLGIMDLHVAWTARDINMLEAWWKEASMEMIHDALPIAQDALGELAAIQEAFLAKVGHLPQLEITKNLPSEPLIAAVKAQIPESLYAKLSVADKREFDMFYAQMEKELMSYFASSVDPEELPWTKNQIKMAWFQVLKYWIRDRVMHEWKRIDGRTVEQIRSIYCELDTVPRCHWTGLFRRGDTQVLSFLTLWSPGDAQLKDGMEHDGEESRFMHHYKMPPFSNNEAMMIRGTNRRETGHGRLAEKAIEAVLPPAETFPYTIRLVSEVLGSGWSTSMASVCGSTLALMAWWVPISAPVSGIAMGMISTDDDQVILTDIMGTEDFIGDMDFKLAWTTKGMTAIQMDIKLKWISVSKLQEILIRSQTWREIILQYMLQTIDKPRESLSQYAPLLLQFAVKPEQVREVIGPGGSVIQEIVRQTGVKIDLEDDGTGVITAVDQAAWQRAMQMIREVVWSPSQWDVITGKITRVEQYGVFVDLGKKKTGMCHVSKLGEWRLEHPSSLFSVWQEITVKISGFEWDKIQLERVK